MNGEPFTNRSIRIADQVFDLFPEYRRGLVFANDIQNGQSPDSLLALLRQQEQQTRLELAGQDVNAVPRLERWREAFRLTGIKPTKFRPSIDGLARRVLSGNDLPSINRVVDIGNLVSLKYLVPVGAHATDVIQTGMHLRPADGSEDFCSFGTQEWEHPEPGEIIFADGAQVMTRRWAWRQAEHSIVKDSTTAVEFNIDLLPPLPDDLYGTIIGDVQELVDRFCGGTLRTALLERLSPQAALDEP